MQVRGSLIAVGTANDSIRFLRTGAIVGGIAFSGGGSSELQYAWIGDVYADTAVWSTGIGSGVRIEGPGTHVTMAHSDIATVGRFPDCVAVADGARLAMAGCTVSHRYIMDWGIVYGGNVAFFGFSVGGSFVELTDCTISWVGGMILGTSEIRLSRCVVTGSNRNWRGPWSIIASNTRGTIEECVPHGTATLRGDLSLNRCTIAGGVSGVDWVARIALGSTVSLTNSIIWGLIGEIDVDSAVVSYSTIPGDTVTAGVGNSNADPLFVDAESGDYRLRPGSPAIDAGGSRADMGALGVAAP